MRKAFLSILALMLSVVAAASLMPVKTVAYAGESEAVTTSADIQINATSAILMDAATGTVLFEQNADEALPPASVTKVMTLLIVMEAIESGRITPDEMVTTSEHAANMGGSQVFLEVGEQLSVEDMVKCIVIASANDCAAALAEHISGSEDAFVSEMNRRAGELGMKNTVFENTNGLDDTTKNHVTSARDIAIMSRELIKYDMILKYSGTWMDSIRGGSFVLTNTNRLVRFYPGATGLKTGSTAKAKFCISATAKRGDMHLIAVIMGAPTRDIRNDAAKTLFDYGFANYAVYTDKFTELPRIPLVGSVKDSCELYYNDASILVDKSRLSKIERSVELPQEIAAPIEEGAQVGRVVYRVGEEIIGETPIYIREGAEKITFSELFIKILQNFLHRV